MRRRVALAPQAVKKGGSWDESPYQGEVVKPLAGLGVKPESAVLQHFDKACEKPRSSDKASGNNDRLALLAS